MSKPWTERENELIALNYRQMTHEDLGAIMGRTKNAVRNQCHKLGLLTAPLWTEAEVQALRAYYLERDGEPVVLDDLANLFGKDKTNICRKAKELGLTNQERPHSAEHITKCVTGQRLWHETHEHPRGFQGHRHTEEARASIAENTRQMWQDPDCLLNSEAHRQSLSDRMVEVQATGKGRRRYSRSAGGTRDDLGFYVRSAWEANYARYLKWLVEQGEIKAWEYEPEVFVFDQIKRGTRSYTPDFKIWERNGSIVYHEVKGWMDPKSQVKLNRMAKYYPEIEIVLIGEDEYSEIRKSVSALIPNWE